MIVCHMLVGPGERDNRLELVLDRARAWADQIFCVLDPGAETRERMCVDNYADAWWQGTPLFVLDEAAARQAAWNLMTIALDPSPEDWIVVLDSDEVIQSPELMGKASRTFPGKRVGFTIHHMWDRHHFRLDGRFAPRIEYLMFPFRSGGHWPTGSVSRAPEYVRFLPQVAQPLADIVHYGFRNDSLRREKLKRDQARGRMSPAEILSEPILESWEKGGVAHV